MEKSEKSESSEDDIVDFANLRYDNILWATIGDDNLGKAFADLLLRQLNIMPSINWAKSYTGGVDATIVVDGHPLRIECKLGRVGVSVRKNRLQEVQHLYPWYRFHGLDPDKFDLAFCFGIKWPVQGNTYATEIQARISTFLQGGGRRPRLKWTVERALPLMDVYVMSSADPFWKTRKSSEQGHNLGIMTFPTKENKFTKYHALGGNLEKVRAVINQALLQLGRRTISPLPALGDSREPPALGSSKGAPITIPSRDSDSGDDDDSSDSSSSDGARDDDQQ